MLQPETFQALRLSMMKVSQITEREITYWLGLSESGKSPVRQVTESLIERWAGMLTVETVLAIRDWLKSEHSYSDDGCIKLDLGVVNDLLRAELGFPCVGAAPIRSVPPRLDADTVKILKFLARVASATHEQIALEGGVTRATISKRVKILKEAGYADVPTGQKRGVCITDDGRKRLADWPSTLD